MNNTYSDGSSALGVQVPNVQQQFGSSDCGLFAIAFMLHLT